MLKRCPAGSRRVHGKCEKKPAMSTDDDHYAPHTLWSKWKSQDASHFIPERTYSKFYIEQLLVGYRESNPDRDYMMLPKNHVPEIELEKEHDRLHDEKAKERRKFNEEEWQRRQDAERVQDQEYYKAKAEEEHGW